MSRGSGARIGAFVALVLLAGAAFIPLAAADHAYSHRFILYGRVLDSEGNAVQGVTVNLGYSDFHPSGACENQPDTETEAHGITRTEPVTNQYGEFIFCFHVHEMPRALPGTGIVRIDEERFNETIQFDPYFRVAFYTAHLDHVSEKANKESLEKSYLIQGRLWRPAGKLVYVEANPVFGYTSNNVPVNITFEHDGTTETFTTKSNNYGDFAYRVNTTKRVTDGKVTIEAGGESHTYGVDGKSAMTIAEVELAKQTDPVLKGLLYVGGGIVLLAVVGGAGWYGWRRVSQAREERIIRERAQRKRANK